MPDIADPAAPGDFHRLPRDRTAPRRAREWVRRKLRASEPSLDADTEFDLLLCTSELVNAALLAGSQQMTLSLVAEPSRVRVTLEADVPVPAGRNPAALAQRQCFRIVERLALRWGLDPTAVGRIGWAEFRPDSREPPSD